MPTAANSCCADVVTWPSALTTVDTPAALGFAASCCTAVSRLVSADFSPLVWDCQRPFASLANFVAAVLTFARSVLTSFTAPCPGVAWTCVSVSREVRKPAAPAQRAELAAETDEEVAAGDEDPPDVVLLPLEHATPRSATPHATAVSRRDRKSVV